MRRCPFRVNKTIANTEDFRMGRVVKEATVVEEYPFCTTDCAYHNDENGKCMRVSMELSKLMTIVHLIDK